MLGQGAMGVVYEAVHPALQRTVAIKLLHHAVTQRPQAMERFRREALAASRIEHPNSTRVLDFGEENGACYIVTEYLEGQSLGELVEETGPLSLDRAVWLLSQVLSALAVAHDNGIVHRDLKPDNVMVVAALDDRGLPTEQAKVCDFGIAKLFGPDSSETLTQDGSVSGTPHYMSPEQCQGAKLDARSDLYACGVILYRLVTGVVPFTGDNPFAIVYRHVTETARPPSAIRPELGPQVDAFIATAMAKQPGQRFQSARSMRSMLRGLTSEASTEPGVAAVPGGSAAPVGSVAPGAPEAAPGAPEAAPDLSALAAQSAMRPGDTRRAWPWIAAVVATLVGGLVWLGDDRADPAAAVPVAAVSERLTAPNVAMSAPLRQPTVAPAAPPTHAPEVKPTVTAQRGVETPTAPPAADLTSENAEKPGAIDVAATESASVRRRVPRRRRAAKSPSSEARKAEPRPAGANHAKVAVTAAPQAPPVAPVAPAKTSHVPAAPTPSPTAKAMPAAQPAAPPVPQRVAKPAFNPDPAIALGSLKIDGGLSRRVISKALAGLPASAKACWQTAGLRGPTVVRVTFTVDEDGRFRAVKGAGTPKTLVDCVVRHVARLRSRVRPDTGTVDVSTRVVFTP